MKVAYLLRNFPVRSETFILHEIVDHLEAGLDIDIFVLGRREEADPIDLDERVARRVTYLDLPARNRRRALGALLLGYRRPLALFKAGAQRTRIDRDLNTVWSTTYLTAALLRRSFGRYDLVHCHFGEMGRLAAAARRAGAFRGALLTSIHGYDVSKKRFGDLRTSYRLLFDECARLLPVSAFWRDRLAANGCPADKIRVQRMGVRVGSAGPEARTCPGPVRLFSVGRMVEKKGHIFAIRAMAALLRRRPELDLRFEIVGGGPLLDQARAEVERLGLGGAVLLRGARDHRDALAGAAACDIFVLTSVTAADGDMEGIPVSLMEAMALSKPVVTSIHSGIPELVEAGRTGLLAPEADVPAISRAIERLVDDPSYRAALGAAGRAKVERDFNEAALGTRLRAIYREVLDERRASPSMAGR